MIYEFLPPVTIGETRMYGEKHLSRRELRSCMDLGKALTSELEPNKLFATILRKLSDMIPADIWSLLLLDRDTNELRFKLSVDLDMEEVKDIIIKPGQGIAGKVAMSQKPMVVEDVKKVNISTTRSTVFPEKSPSL